MAAIALVLVLGLVGGVLTLVFSGGGVSKADFIAQADDICRAIGEETAAIQPSDPTDPGEFYSAVLALLERQTREIRALEAPEEDAATLDAWLETQDKLAENFQSLAEEDASGIAETTETQAESTRLAIEYGFNDCGIATPS